MSVLKPKRYAVMFLNSLDEAGEAGASRSIEELLGLAGLMAQSPEFRGLMVNPVFTSAERKEALSSIAEAQGLTEGTLRFVRYLGDEGAGALLGEVARRASEIHDERMNLVKATVITPAKIKGEEYDERLRASLGKLTGRTVKIEYRTDASLIGGMLVKVGSTMYDGSVEGQLRLLRAELIKG